MELELELAQGLEMEAHPEVEQWKRSYVFWICCVVRYRRLVLVMGW